MQMRMRLWLDVNKKNKKSELTCQEVRHGYQHPANQRTEHQIRWPYLTLSSFSLVSFLVVLFSLMTVADADGARCERIADEYPAEHQAASGRRRHYQAQHSQSEEMAAK